MSAWSVWRMERKTTRMWLKLLFSSSFLTGRRRSKIGRQLIPFTAPGMAASQKANTNPAHSFFSILFLFVRHLAKKWETEYIPPHTKRRLIPGYSATEISTIEHLILLDLLGAPNPIVRNSFSDTAWLFDGMIDVERRLLEQGVFNSSDATSTQALQHSFFLSRDVPHLNLGGIEDDHIPFLRLGVSVLHIITNPFPRVWHKLSVRFHSFLGL